MGNSTQFELSVNKLAGEDAKKTTVYSIPQKLEGKETVDADELKKDLLALDGTEHTTDSIIENLRNINKSAAIAIQEDGSTSENCKWYEHEDDLRKFSKMYPNWLFQLDGGGEESGDVWRKYFVNGEMQNANAKTVYEDFDRAKLK